MKIFLTIILASIVLYSCEKGNSGPEDEIYVFSIDKEVTLNNPDSISLGGCSPILFEIHRSNEDIFEASMNFADYDGLCIGGSITKFLVNEKVVITSLEEGSEINKKGNWGYGTDLKDFAGKGEMYIGYKEYAIPDEETTRRFGWIKIDLTEKMDTLHIISYAENLTANNPIKAGQME